MTKLITLVAIAASMTQIPVLNAVAADDQGATALSLFWDKPTLDLLASGNAERGSKLSKQAKCSKFHGDTGISDKDDTPSVAGQIAGYTYKQLVDYKDNARDAKVMYKEVKKLSPQDFVDIAAWYAIQTPEPMANKDAVPPELVTRGDKKRLLLPCAVCHGQQGEGKKVQTPSLAGQKIEYLNDTLAAFKYGDRANDLYGRMHNVAQRLSDEDMVVLAEYYAAAPAEEDAGE
jgi:cytochrome c553